MNGTHHSFNGEDSGNIWAFQQSLSNRLIRWNLVNIGVGLLLSFFSPFWRGFGSQGIGWGVINILIGIIGGRAARQKAAQPDAQTAEKQVHEATNLFRLLIMNAGLDMLYMMGGQQLIRKSAAQPYRRGMGWGIVLQGFLLLVFDVTQAVAVPRPRSDRSER
ncbi:MAG: hypothetical protein JNM70_14395 [Anaerolineae bacterium]|nr:hypothetical protein [Anaerolineae bacterium]